MDATSLARVAAARLGLAPTPLSLGFELTHLCNLACSYCDRNKRLKNEMTREQIFGVLAEFLELGTRHVSLDGGEPLAHPDVDDIVAFLIARRARVYMNTNGVLIPRKIASVRRLARLKISLDGPRQSHDSMRGKGAFDRALCGAKLARDAGVPVEFTCVVGTHNAECLDELLELVERLDFSIVFQPARNSLFLDSSRNGSGFMLDRSGLNAAFTRIEAFKHAGRAVANRWSSLRHFRSFPDDRRPPCAAGWINATLDPEGFLFHCALVSRSEKRHNVLELGAKTAFERLLRQSCSQCWCARVVEENYAWGGRLDMLLPPEKSDPGRSRQGGRRLKVLG